MLKPIPLTEHYLFKVQRGLIRKGYPVSKWVIFARQCLNLGYKVSLYASKSTVSKYIYVQNKDKKLKIRFSNHKASFGQELKQDSDYYVGVGNRSCHTTDQILELVKRDLGDSKYEKARVPDQSVNGPDDLEDPGW